MGSFIYVAIRHSVPLEPSTRRCAASRFKGCILCYRNASKKTAVNYRWFAQDCARFPTFFAAATQQALEVLGINTVIGLPLCHLLACLDFKLKMAVNKPQILRLPSGCLTLHGIVEKSHSVSVAKAIDHKARGQGRNNGKGRTNCIKDETAELGRMMMQGVQQ